MQAVETAARLAGETDRAPPSDEQMAHMQALERSIFSGEFLKSVVREVPGGRAVKGQQRTWTSPRGKPRMTLSRYPAVPAAR